RSGPRGSRRAAHQRSLRRPPASRLRRARAPAQAMNRRYRTPQRHVRRGAATALVLAVLGVLASWRLATGQGSGVWQVRPAEPTVGDTIWLEAVITVPGGWGLRAGKLEPTERLEPLGDPALRRTPGGGGWLVRYPVVAWSPGAHTVALPLMWRLAPDGRADSVPGGNATVLVRSVIPDSVRHPEPRGRVPGGGRAHAAPRAATGAAGSAGAARPGRVLCGPRDGRGRARRHGASPDAGDRPVSFARPLFLGLLALLPLWWWLRARRLARLSGTRMSDVRPAEGVTERLWVARLPVTLRSVCLGAWMVAAAGPRLGSARKETRSEGISIVLCVDLSSSMLAEDFAPANRIDVAKQTALEFVRARTSDRIGVVAFAAQALTQVPITTDYAVLEEALRELRVGMLEDGTAIGTAIATAASRLRRAPGKSKVIILLTDGVNNRGTVDPRTAAQAAAAFGIRIYTIGVGTRGEAPVPTGQGVDGLRYQNLPVEI